MRKFSEAMIIIFLGYFFHFSPLPAQAVNLPVKSSSPVKSVVLIIDPVIYNSISAAIGQFTIDLTADGYNVILNTNSYSSPESLRQYLQNLYSTTNPKLSGAYLIGNIPLARQRYQVTFTNPNIPTQYYMGVTTQFYSDLDGQFTKSDPSYPTHYTSHTGDVYSEIWISLIPQYKNDNILTIQKINKYFEKNHKFRTGELLVYTGYLEINEHYNASTLGDYNGFITGMTTGQYAWIPFTTWGNTGSYIWNSVGKPDVTYAIDNELGSINYGFCTHAAHGIPTANGSINTDWVLSHKLGMIFLFLDGCNVGDLDYPDNITSATLYSDYSNVLAVKGATTESGGLGTNQTGYYGKNIATSMMNNKSFGEAFIEHNRTPLISPWSSNFDQHYMPTIFLGDLSLSIKNLIPNDRPILLEPLNNSNTPLDVTLSWSNLPKALSYRFQISTSSQFSTIVKDTTLALNFLRINNLVNNSTYYWRVSAQITGQQPIWSAIYSFTAKSSILAKPVLIDPSNNSTGHQLNIQLKWSKVYNAAGYRLQFSESSVFSTLILDTANIVDTAIAIKDLKPAKYYFWRIKANNSSGSSEWSTIYSFKTYNLPLPETPRPAYPQNNSSRICISPYLSWSSSATAEFYRLQVSEKSDFSTRFKDIGGIAFTRLKVTGFSPDITYYWRVNATNSTGTSNWSEHYTFSTSSSSPTDFQTMLPSSNSVLQLVYPKNSIKFMWGSSKDMDMGDSIKYTFMLTGSGFTKTMSNLIDTSLSMDIMNNLKSSTRYDWYVEATDGIFKVKSPTVNFTTSKSVTDIKGDEIEKCNSYSLYQNYPNPFNPSTFISYSIPEDAFVKIDIFNYLGQIVNEPLKEFKRKGIHSLRWFPVNLPSGCYYYKISAKDFSAVKKMLYIR